ncbi:putative bifunctional diguanylate cyclase/phosphodiesterase [Actinomycetospora termitidis]|uniref:Bifunctional diguanylate cyclase/phosphodiesterase n=1 Tax=Actinomycetospora termitidis TaxID=3053470 RepID=A0ABT7M428_9PSEU|nr:bifunctional diguanylate cyclase/phosphodiesterase [Actinomycetospora sp. Odt1-22]MDL5155404.1 bifunctional diguanylate cyclase/phosphodiesterase [Actinomycetospora sp. Odt1-22]
MSALVLTALVVVVVAVLALVVVIAMRAARRRRTSDLRTLGAVGRALAAHASRRGTDDGRAAARAVAEALRQRFDARRVVIAVATLVEQVGVPLPDDLRAVDLVAPDEAFRPGRGASRWHRRSAPVAVRSWMRARGTAEILVAPVAAPELYDASGEAQPPEVVRSRRGVIEIHEPGRGRRGGGRRMPGRSRVRGELALLATIARQVGAEVENTRLEARLRRDAHRDPLTDLLNRSGFLQATARELHAGGGAVAVVSFGLIDQVNDTLGHASGEQFVTLAARRLEAVCGSGRAASVAPGARLAARLEGDTFAVVVADVDPETAHRSAIEMRDHLVRPLVVEGIPFEAPVLVGVAAAGVPGLAGERDGHVLASRLLSRADIALSAAREGSGPVRCYEPSMGERADRRLALIRGFGPAVTDGHLRVHYQPTVSLEGRTVLGVEALARWEHPELGALLPDEFVPVLEATGQIGGLTEFVLDESLAAARRWHDRGMRLSVAVNLSVGSLDDGFPDLVAAALDRHGVPAELLILEVTESGVSAEREYALPALRRLHALGCRLAVDDFGTGQSSLAHLRRLPVDTVKIDKSFVLGMGTETGDVAVVRAIVEMGHTLGLTVVAEGVESAAVRTALADMGCDVAQGYLVSKPLPAGCLEQWLDSLAEAGGAPPGAEGGPVRWSPPTGTAPGTTGAA